jgi:hypothetical protein
MLKFNFKNDKILLLLLKNFLVKNSNNKTKQIKTN